MSRPTERPACKLAFRLGETFSLSCGSPSSPRQSVTRWSDFTDRPGKRRGMLEKGRTHQDWRPEDRLLPFSYLSTAFPSCAWTCGANSSGVSPARSRICFSFAGSFLRNFTGLNSGCVQACRLPEVEFWCFGGSGSVSCYFFEGCQRSARSRQLIDPALWRRARFQQGLSPL